MDIRKVQVTGGSSYVITLPKEWANSMHIKKNDPLATPSIDVIDILDFGQFMANYGLIMDPNTYCPIHDPGGAPTVGHADINGDGIVDSLDFSFITMNFLEHSKGACCPDGVSEVPTPVLSATVQQLREWGMSDLIRADLNNDGVLDVQDMQAFQSGKIPRAGGLRK